MHLKKYRRFSEDIVLICDNLEEEGIMTQELIDAALKDD